MAIMAIMQTTEIVNNIGDVEKAPIKKKNKNKHREVKFCYAYSTSKDGALKMFLFSQKHGE